MKCIFLKNHQEWVRSWVVLLNHEQIMNQFVSVFNESVDSIHKTSLNVFLWSSSWVHFSNSAIQSHWFGLTDLSSTHRLNDSNTLTLIQCTDFVPLTWVQLTDWMAWCYWFVSISLTEWFVAANLS